MRPHRWAMPAKPHRPLAGILWMIATGFCFVMVTACVKIGGQGLPAAQSAFLRYLLGLVFLIPMIRPILRANLSRGDLGLFGLRGLFHALGVICWFYAMTRIPIADVTAMNYLNPIYVSILAVVFLGETMAKRRVLAIAVAFLGALLILRPGFRDLSTGHVAMIFTALFFAGGYFLAKILADRVSAVVVVGMLSVVVTVILAPMAIAVWQPVTGMALIWLFLVACFATAGHYTMTLAFAAAPLSVTQPATFLQLIWATILGAVVFGEAVDPFVLAGGAVIIAAVTTLALREAQVARKAVPPAPQG